MDNKKADADSRKRLAYLMQVSEYCLDALYDYPLIKGDLRHDEVVAAGTSTADHHEAFVDSMVRFFNLAKRVLEPGFDPLAWMTDEQRRDFLSLADLEIRVEPPKK